MRTHFLSPLGSALKKIAVTFLFRDDFTTDESAPLTSPRTAEPGPGTGTIVDTGDIMSIVSNQLRINGTGLIPQPYYVDNVARSRSAGLVLLSEMTRTTGNVRVGWTSAIGVRPTRPAILVSTSVSVYTPTFMPAVYGGTLEKVALVIRDDGSFSLVHDGVDWILLWVRETETTTPLYAVLSWHSSFTIHDFNNFRVSQLPAPWDTDYDIATERLAGARSAGDTFTHEADCTLEFEEETVPSGGQTEFAFREQDLSNYWLVTIDSSGNIDLDEVVAGSPTQRGTSAGVIANSDRIVVICDDETIKIYEANNLRITYNGAVNFKTATAGRLLDEGTGGAVSDIISWPRTLSGAAKAALDAVANA